MTAVTIEAPAGRADLAEVRRSMRASAHEVELRHLDELERHDAGRGAMAAPPPLERIPGRLGLGRYRSSGGSDYDWFYGLAKAEQERLRDNWFSSSPNAQSPDEVFDKVRQSDWLEQTRIVDASHLIAQGRAREYNAKRYGGMNLNSLVEGEPYDVRKVYSTDEETARRHVERAQSRGGGGRTWRERAWGSEPDRSRCQFFTDENGVVHPIRATCPPEEGEGYHTARDYTAEELEEF